MAGKTTTRTVSRDILEERWKVAMRGVTRLQGEAAISPMDHGLQGCLCVRCSTERKESLW